MTAIPKNILSHWRIVVVDDEEDSLELAEALLLEYGATVFTAQNGQEALEIIRQTQPDLVISDVSMPVMDGWGLIDTLKRNRTYANLPIIALTAHAMRGDRERAIAAGFHNYLTKPLTATTFMRDLLNLLIEIPEMSAHLTAFQS
ncbi:MAG: response regulator [Anaerolineae bacterium]|nr:response regulator [Anaerolineae bacterium]